jgi:hypothetical protein
MTAMNTFGGRRRDRQTGQAAIETILLSFVLITFVAAMFQIYLVNRTVFRSISTAHQQVFARAFARNRCTNASSDCKYSTDPGPDGATGIAPRVIWSPTGLPEVRIPVVRIFGRYGLNQNELRLWSDKRTFDAICPGLPCKRTKVGAGTYMGPFDALAFLTKIDWSSITF